MVIYVPQFYLFVVVLHSDLGVSVFFKHEIKYVMRNAPDIRPYCIIQYPVYPVSGISGIRYIRYPVYLVSGISGFRLDNPTVCVTAGFLTSYWPEIAMQDATSYF